MTVEVGVNVSNQRAAMPACLTSSLPAYHGRQPPGLLANRFREMGGGTTTTMDGCKEAPTRQLLFGNNYVKKYRCSL
eukprot:365162-Chlamydomonas_euryale.AAC.13